MNVLTKKVDPYGRREKAYAILLRMESKLDAILARN
jgi:hypothetical protein